MSELQRYTELVRFLRSTMETNSWTQVDFANAIGTSQPVISDWLRGVSQPGEQSKRALAKLAGMTFDEFERMLDGIKGEPELELPKSAETAHALLKLLSKDEKKRLIAILLNDL